MALCSNKACNETVPRDIRFAAGSKDLLKKIRQTDFPVWYPWTYDLSHLDRRYYNSFKILKFMFLCKTLRQCYVALQVARKNSRVTPHLHLQLLRCELQESRTTLYFSQRCETSCLHVTSPQQLATQFRQNGTNQSSSFARLRASPGPSCLLLYALQVAKKVANVWHPLCNLKGFLFVIVALQVARKIASSGVN